MKKLIAAALCVLVVIGGLALVCIAGIFAAISTVMPGNSASPCTAAPASSLNVDPSALPIVPGYTAEQLSIAAQIMKVGADVNIGERGQLIALMTAMQESDLGADQTTHVPNADGDAGPFQQRQLPGWYGTLEQVNDPAYAARAFFQGVDVTQTVKGGAGNAGYHIPGLADVKDWQTKALTQAASAVQRPAERYENEYAKHEAEARSLMTALAGVPVTAASGSVQDPTLGCDPGGALPAVTAGQLPTQAQLMAPSAQYACPEGTTDLGQADGGVNSKHVPIRLCSITGTVCTGADCRKGELGGLARGEVVLNSLVAPHFIAWLTTVRAAGYNPTFNSSFRTWSSQIAIYRGGANGNAAAPGKSNHQMGAAVDISGLGGSYDRDHCSGHAPDGSCMSTSGAWATYHSAGLANCAVFHDEEFWHLEWIVTRAESRNIPFILAA